MESLKYRRIVLGVSGGIAAYKTPELVRLLRKAGHEVRVILTPAAQAFITPLTLQAVSGNPVHTDLLDRAAESAMGHIELARWADLIIVAPATADILARMACGQANDLLTTVCLASAAKIAVAPAMNQAMWRNPVTQENVERLAGRGVAIWGPGVGEQACGDFGPGRMIEAIDLADQVLRLCQTVAPLKGLAVIVTAGPTREPLDPVRYISNHSSGKMGYAMAEAASQAGAEVHLVSGPTNLPPPLGVMFYPVETAQAMLATCLQLCPGKDLFIAAAAVADYRAATVAEQKIKKGGDEHLTLSLIKNPDIVATVATLAPRPFIVGFAAETQNLLVHAREKLQRKKLDMVIANDVSIRGVGFNSDDNQVTLISATEEVVFAKQSKAHLAATLILHIAEAMKLSGYIDRPTRGE